MPKDEMMKKEMMEKEMMEKDGDMMSHLDAKDEMIKMGFKKMPVDDGLGEKEMVASTMLGELGFRRV